MAFSNDDNLHTDQKESWKLYVNLRSRFGEFTTLWKLH